MERLCLAENLTMFRKNRKITQEQLADFCGVTKASVSKWETGQTLPDILLLPKLAAFFEVSIDELMGYERNLSPEQIQKISEELRMEFAVAEFPVVMEKCREYVKKYYSCYELLEKMVLLWISHEMLAGGQRQELLKEAKELCKHILDNCKNLRLRNDILFLQAIIELLSGNPEATIDVLEDMSDPCRLSVQTEDVLLSAYIECGLWERGNDFAQISMYLHLLMLVIDAGKFLFLHRDNLEKCEETNRRMEAVIKLYDLDRLNFHFISLYYYQMAEVYCEHEKKERALEQLSKYVELQEEFLLGKVDYLQDDSYFERLHVWYEKSILSGSFPRGKRTVYVSMMQALNAPALACLAKEEAYKNLLEKVEKLTEKLVEEI